MRIKRINQTVSPISPYKTKSSSSFVDILEGFHLIDQSIPFLSWISLFKSLLDSKSRPRSVYKRDFDDRARRICLLNTDVHDWIRGMNSCRSGYQLDRFDRYLMLENKFILLSIVMYHQF